MLVGCDYHPASNKLPMSIRKRENCKSGELGIARKWKPVDTHAGLNDCSRKVLSRSRSARVEGACRRGFNIKYEVGPASGLLPRSRLNGTVRSWSDSTIIVEAGCESA